MMEVRVYTKTAALIAVIDNVANITFLRSWSNVGTFGISLNRNAPYATELQIGRFILINKNSRLFGIITEIKYSQGPMGKGDEVITVSGYESKFILGQRIIIPAASQVSYALTDKADTVMKSVVNSQCVSATDTNRNFDDLIIQADLAVGDSYSLVARYTNLLEELQACSLATGTGFFITFDKGLKKYTFCTGQGTDRTVNQWVNSRAIFSTRFDTVETLETTESYTAYKNIATVGGQGIGAARTIRQVVIAPEATGLDRREVWVDARDLATSGLLDARGAQVLEETNQTIFVDANILEYSPLKLGTDYDLGDKVTIETIIGSYDMVITEVMESWAPLSYEIDLTFDKKLPEYIRQAKKDQMIQVRINNASES